MPTMYAVCVIEGKAQIKTYDVTRDDPRHYSVGGSYIEKRGPLGRRMKLTIPDAKKYFRAKQRKEIANQQIIIIRAQQQIEQIQGWVNDLDHQPPKG